MLIVIIDGQGGGVGRSLAEKLLSKGIGAKLRVVGSNAAATANMMRAGSVTGATGENAVAYNCARADIIVGPVGIILPNAMYGEITPAMALAVGESAARKVLVPVSDKHARIVGLVRKPLAEYIDEAADAVAELAANGEGKDE